jgi:hypothetical protein
MINNINLNSNSWSISNGCYHFVFCLLIWKQNVRFLFIFLFCFQFLCDDECEYEYDDEYVQLRIRDGLDIKFCDHCTCAIVTARQ